MPSYVRGDSNFDTASAEKLTLMTAQNSTSGTYIDFVSIPSWAKRITVMFSGVSTSGASDYLIQIGDGSINSTGYFGASIRSVNASNNIGLAYTLGFGINNPTQSGSATIHGLISLCFLGLNKWAASGVISDSTSAITSTAGSKQLSGTLDRIRITTVNGTDTFDAGQINVMYEG